MAREKNHLGNPKGEDEALVEFSFTQHQLTFIALAVELARDDLMRQHDICKNCIDEFTQNILAAATFLRDQNNAARKNASAKLPDNEIEKRMFRESGKRAK